MTKIARFVALAVIAGTSACVPVGAEVRVDLPAVLPPLVTVEAGVQVVEGYPEEIFFVDGFYWVRRGGYWYRSVDPYSRWVYVAPAQVPVAIVRIPPGRYAHYRRDARKEWRGENEGRGEGRGHGPHERD